eukprot:4581847-Alexandrium_andersonii.AAC.1
MLRLTTPKGVPRAPNKCERDTKKSWRASATPQQERPALRAALPERKPGGAVGGSNGACALAACRPRRTYPKPTRRRRLE